jgi:uncharacterized alkaline shock family protein YloU
MRGETCLGSEKSERMDMSEDSGSQGSPLKSESGSTTISNTVVSQIAGIAAQEVEEANMGGGGAVGGLLRSVTGGSGNSLSQGVTVEVGEEETAIDLSLSVAYGQSIPRISQAVRDNVIKRVESLTGLRVNEVNIQVNDVQLPQEQQQLQEQQA